MALYSSCPGRVSLEQISLNKKDSPLPLQQTPDSDNKLPFMGILMGLLREALWEYLGKPLLGVPKTQGSWPLDLWVASL